MKKREIKREKELFKKLSGIIRKLDSYEEIYPEKEIEEKQRLNERTINELKLMEDTFYGTSLSEYINNLIDIENEIREKGMLYEEELIKALYVRDRINLLCLADVKNDADIDKDMQAAYYADRRESLAASVWKNTRTICITDNHKQRMHALRIRKKTMIYMDVIDSSLKDMKEGEHG